MDQLQILDNLLTNYDRRSTPTNHLSKLCLDAKFYLDFGSRSANDDSSVLKSESYRADVAGPLPATCAELLPERLRIAG